MTSTGRLLPSFQVVVLFLLTLCAVVSASAEDDRFDLSGPTIRMNVTRGAVTLPIAQVANLLPGDLLAISPQLPSTQLNHLLIIVVFLRSSTNEPPDEWFTKIETWKAPSQETRIRVPVGAQSALVFVAPETGGDFTSLRSVVKRSPGVFLRASASLFKLSLEQQRTERYLAGMQSVAHEDAGVIAHRSASLASALLLKPNEDCFKQSVEDQVDCLTQTSDAMLLDNGSQQTASASISTGASSDFINEASQNDGGTYSAYVGTVIDLVHLLGLLHTAQYRYIPAIALPDGADLRTRLNAAPSFSNPKSVIVIPMPPIRPSRLPDLHLVDPDKVLCLRNPAMVVPLRGSSILYSTAYAHDLKLQFQGPERMVVLPLTTDVVAGGLVVTLPQALSTLASGIEDRDSAIVQATLSGRWGFDAFDGPLLTFQRKDGVGWRIVNHASYQVGSKAIDITSDAMACLNRVLVGQPESTFDATTFSSSGDGHATRVSLPIQDQAEGRYSLQLFEYGASSPVTLSFTLQTNGGGQLQHARVINGGSGILLTGSNMEELAGASIHDEDVILTAMDENTFQGRAPGFAIKAGEEMQVRFRDGRTQTTVLEAEEDSLDLHVVSTQASVETPSGEIPVELQTTRAIPLHSVLHFAVTVTGHFAVTDRIEVATRSGSITKSLGFEAPSSSLVLENDHTAVGSLDLDQVLGDSAFGVLQVRLLRNTGDKGTWVPLGAIVRRPQISRAVCHRGQCELRGKELFLIAEVSVTSDFKSSTLIPATEIGDTMSFALSATNLQPPALFVRLRDDPSAVARISLQTK